MTECSCLLMLCQKYQMFQMSMKPRVFDGSKSRRSWWISCNPFHCPQSWKLEDLSKPMMTTRFGHWTQSGGTSWPSPAATCNCLRKPTTGDKYIERWAQTQTAPSKKQKLDLNTGQSIKSSNCLLSCQLVHWVLASSTGRRTAGGHHCSLETPEISSA